MTTQEKFEFIALSWGKIPTKDIAKRVHDDVANIHTYVLRMRVAGVPIPKLLAEPLVRKRRGPGVDYEKIKNLFVK